MKAQYVEVITNSDGSWLIFRTVSGNRAMLNVEHCLDRQPAHFTNPIIREWCQERQTERRIAEEDEREEIANNGQFGGGAV